MQRRAELYMKTLDEGEDFEGHEYISWICYMCAKYKQENDMHTHEPIRDNAAFTNFIEKEVKDEQNEMF